MPKQSSKPIQDLPATNAADVKGGMDPLHLLAQVNHLQSQDAASSVKQVAAKQKAAIK